MTLVKVKNVPDTTGQIPPYPCESWLKYWEKKTGKRAGYCARCGCMNMAAHGAHVKKCDVFFDTSTYIVPLCADCNNPNNTQEFYVDCDLCLVC